MKFVWISEGQISPDGKQVAFTRVVINEGKDDYETSLWLVPADGSVSAAQPVVRHARQQPAMVA